MTAPRPLRSLRGRLLTATLVLVAMGLAVTCVATYAFLNSFLLSRLDAQLRASQAVVTRALTGPPSALDETGDQVFVPFGGAYAAVLDPSGDVLRALRSVGYDGAVAPAPTLPAGLPGSQGATDGGTLLFTTGSAGDLRYRAMAVPLADGAGTVVVAAALTDVTDTLHRLVVVEALVVGGVLVLAALSALGLVRLGLRPLTDIEETAGAIAAGDLSRRVTLTDPDTEVGRLGIALNAMLAQIEAAFAERTASEERLRRFVADASHELRTPLTSIGGYAELFRRGAADRPEDLAKTMERIEREAARMGVLVEDLLLLARLDEGVAVTRSPLDLTALAARAVEAAHAAELDRPTVLEAAGPVTVEADEDRLRQVLDNLLANARVHTPAGTPVTVRVAERDGAAMLEVADAGPGVPPEDRDRIFERFSRADPSRSRGPGAGPGPGAGQGAGLGLAIASEIARAHGGALELVPTEAGATFRLTIPAGVHAEGGEPERAAEPEG